MMSHSIQDKSLNIKGLLQGSTLRVLDNRMSKKNKFNGQPKKLGPNQGRALLTTLHRRVLLACVTDPLNSKEGEKKMVSKCKTKGKRKT